MATSCRATLGKYLLVLINGLLIVWSLAAMYLAFSLRNTVLDQPPQEDPSQINAPFDMVTVGKCHAHHAHQLSYLSIPSFL
jgi:hypothetical protein